MSVSERGNPAVSTETIDQITAEAEQEIPWFTGVKGHDIDTLCVRVGFALNPPSIAKPSRTDFQSMVDFRLADQYVASRHVERVRSDQTLSMDMLSLSLPKLKVDWADVKRRAIEFLSRYWKNIRKVACDYADKEIGSPEDAKKSGLTAALLGALSGAGAGAFIVGPWGAIIGIIIAFLLSAGLKTVCDEGDSLPKQ